MEGFLGIGGNELLIILVFAFLIFGPDKLPEIARTIGRAIAKFREAQNEVNEVIRKEVYDPATDQDNPFQKVTEKAAELNKPQQPQTETFAERKARYDKIRAERKAKEEAAKAAAEAKAGEAADAPAQGAANNAEPTDDDLDALLGVSKPKPAAAGVSEGGDA
jgi:TatA/E family protein of Tat protein translocase